MEKLYDFADKIDKKILIIRYPNQENRFVAYLENCEVREGSILHGVYGNGKSPKEALEAYYNGIKNTILVFNAYRDNRQEIYFGG